MTESNTKPIHARDMWLGAALALALVGGAVADEAAALDEEIHHALEIVNQLVQEHVAPEACDDPGGVDDVGL